MWTAHQKGTGFITHTWNNSFKNCVGDWAFSLIYWPTGSHCKFGELGGKVEIPFVNSNDKKCGNL